MSAGAGHRRGPEGALASRPVLRDIAVSLAGALVPALVGVAAAVVAGLAGGSRPVVALLLAWTVLGYLALCDLGLTRTAAKLVAGSGQDLGAVVGTLWRTAAVAGLLGGVVVAVVLLLAGAHPALLLLTIAPLTAFALFPVIGALEATGRFGVLALHRLGNALGTYLLPAVLVAGVGGDTALWAAVGLAVAYRAVSLLVLTGMLGLRGSALVRPGVARGARAEGAGSVLTWLAISSVLGPLMLYADRAALWWLGVPDAVWVFYVAVSEILIRTYLVPTAVLAVLFPWFSRHRARRARRTRQVLAVLLPLAVLLGVALVGLLAALAPVPDLPGLGQAGARVLLGLLGAGTVMSWASQVYIAVLQVQDRQRRVVGLQVAVAVPLVVALALVPPSATAAVVVAALWAARVALTLLALLATVASAGLAPPTVPEPAG